jgi:hypothetical protein
MRKSVGGRPKQKTEGREHIGFRAPLDLKRRLEASAEASGNTLSKEIDERLERSYGLSGQITLCLGDQYASVQLHRDELLIWLTEDSPTVSAVLQFTENLELFKEHFGIKK